LYFLTFFLLFLLFGFVFSAFLLATLCLLALIVNLHVILHKDVCITPVPEKGHDAFVVVAVEMLKEATIGGKKKLS
jgi:hypothetical protein